MVFDVTLTSQLSWKLKSTFVQLQNLFFKFNFPSFCIFVICRVNTTWNIRFVDSYVLNKGQNLVQKYSRISEQLWFSCWGVLFWRTLYSADRHRITHRQTQMNTLLPQLWVIICMFVTVLTVTSGYGFSGKCLQLHHTVKWTTYCQVLLTVANSVLLLLQFWSCWHWLATFAGRYSTKSVLYWTYCVCQRRPQLMLMSQKFLQVVITWRKLLKLGLNKRNVRY